MIWWSSLALASDGRLPETVVPTAERLDLAVDPAKTDLVGTATITLDVREPTTWFALHAVGLDFDAVLLTRRHRKPLPVRVTPMDQGLVRIDVDRKLSAGEWTLGIAYHGAVHDETYGLYRFEVDGTPYVTSQLEATEARTSWPCFDEPGIKIPWTLAVTVPQGDEVIGNMPMVSRTPSGNGQETVELAPTPPTSSYAVELSVGPYVGRKVEGMAVPGTVWTVRGHEAFAEGLADELPAIVAAESTWFGAPPPYPKVDWILVPEFTYGAMENPGAIVAAEGASRPLALRTTDEAEETAHVVAHELAHFWFGDQVTMEWWDDLWLNESFAEWLSQQIVRGVHPEWSGEQQRVARTGGVLVHDARPSARALRDPVPPDEVFQHIDFTAVYGKGTAVLDQVDAWLGPAVVQRGVRDYLQAHAFGTARSQDLFAALGRASGQDVTSVLDPYVSTPGAPRLAFERQADGKFRVAQSRLGLAGFPLPAGAWKVPVRMRIGRPGGAVDVVERVLAGPSEDWDLGPVEWILPAADGVGFYAWSLDDADLDALLRAVPSLEPADRLAIVSSLAVERASGARSLSDVLGRLGAFDHETEPPVLSAVAELIASVQLAEVMGDPALEAAAHRYEIDRLEPILDRIGRQPAAGERSATTALRGELVEILARAGDARVRADGMALGSKALADPGSVDPEQARFGLGILAEDGPADIGQQLLARTRAESDPTRRALLLGAFARVHGEDGIRAAIDWAAGPDVPPSEAQDVLYGLLGRDRESERDVTLARVMDAFAPLTAKLAPVRKPDLARFAGGCSQDRLDRARAWFTDPSRAIPGVDVVLRETEGAVATCVAREAADGDSLRKLLGVSG